MLSVLLSFGCYYVTPWQKVSQFLCFYELPQPFVKQCFYNNMISRKFLMISNICFVLNTSFISFTVTLFLFLNIFLQLFQPYSILICHLPIFYSICLCFFSVFLCSLLQLFSFIFISSISLHLFKVYCFISRRCALVQLAIFVFVFQFF